MPQRVTSQALVPKILGSFLAPKSNIASPGPYYLGPSFCSKESNRKPWSLRFWTQFFAPKQALVLKILGSFLAPKSQIASPGPEDFGFNFCSTESNRKPWSLRFGAQFLLQRVKSQALLPKILGSFLAQKSDIASPGP